MPILTRRPPHFGLPALLVVALTLTFASSLSAQVLSDPRIAEFDPSPDHWTVLDSGQPAVLRYALDMYVVGATAPFATLDMGKPAPEADGKIRYDFSAGLTGLPLPGGNYEARVSAVGPQGVAFSDPSNPFTFSGAPSCSATLGTPAFQVGPAGGSYSVAVSTGTSCSWSASNSLLWVTVLKTSGSGSGTVPFDVQANTSTTGRTGTFLIAGQTVTVSQSGASPPSLITPTISWTTPAPITQGTPLSSVQLNAFASVPGVFVYSPPAGTVLPAGNYTLQASFTPEDTAHYRTATAYTTLTVHAALYRLTVSRPSGGMVTGGGGLSCGTTGTTCQVSMSGVTSVVLQATADSGYAFTGWTGDCTGTSPSLTLRVDGERFCGASFAAIAPGTDPSSPPPGPSDPTLGPPYYLTVLRPVGGIVKATGINCGTHANNCTVSMPGPVNISMQASPESGFVFAGWTGDCSGTSPTYTLALEGPRICSAAFAISQ